MQLKVYLRLGVRGPRDLMPVWGSGDGRSCLRSLARRVPTEPSQWETFTLHAPSGEMFAF